MKTIMQLRIPQKLKEYLQNKAKEKGYSLNSLILKVLWEFKEKESMKEKN